VFWHQSLPKYGIIDQLLGFVAILFDKKPFESLSTGLFVLDLPNPSTQKYDVLFALISLQEKRGRLMYGFEVSGLIKTQIDKC